MPVDEKQFTELAIKVEQIDARSRSNAHRITDLESGMKEVKDMQITLVKLADGVENMGSQLMAVKEDIQDVKTGLITLENRPARETRKKWDFICDQLLWLFLSGIAGFLFARILPGIF